MSAASAPIATAGTTARSARILVASSRADFRKRVLNGLAPRVVPTGEAAGGAGALIKLESNEFATVLLDPDIEDLDVPELVGVMQRRFPQLEVVVMERGDGSQQLSFEISGRRVDAAAQLEVETAVLETQASPASYPEAENPQGLAAPQIRIEPLPGMIGGSLRMQQLYRLARLVAPRDTAVLIAGPTGTGKELVARGVHAFSKRSRGPF